MMIARTTVSGPRIETGFAYPGNPMIGDGDDRAWEQTAAPGRVGQAC